MFDCQDTHRQNGLGRSFLAKSTIFAQGDFAVLVETLDAMLFLKETAEPYLTVRV
jgi:hypothetical protein